MGVGEGLGVFVGVGASVGVTEDETALGVTSVGRPGLSPG